MGDVAGVYFIWVLWQGCTLYGCCGRGVFCVWGGCTFWQGCTSVDAVAGVYFSGCCGRGVLCKGAVEGVYFVWILWQRCTLCGCCGSGVLCKGAAAGGILKGCCGSGVLCKALWQGCTLCVLRQVCTL